MFGRKKKKVKDGVEEVKENVVIETKTMGEETPQQPQQQNTPTPIQPTEQQPTEQEKTPHPVTYVLEDYKKDYAGVFVPEEFTRTDPGAVYKAQTCNLLFAIYGELRALRKDLKELE